MEREYYLTTEESLQFALLCIADFERHLQMLNHGETLTYERSTYAELRNLTRLLILKYAPRDDSGDH